jgi:outer membrane receptor for ferrienterochelin and colicins
MSKTKNLIGFAVLSALAVAAGAQPTPPPNPPPDPAPAPVPEGSPPVEPAPAPTTTPAPPPLPEKGKIRGRVVTKAGEPVTGAIVTLVGTPASVMLDGEGQFELEAPLGAHEVEIEATGFTTRRNRVNVAAGQTTSLDMRLEESQLPGEEIVIVGSRLPEKRLDAPVTVELVTEKDLRTAAGASYLSALSRVKGVDFSDSGISEQRISARGFATQFNSRMLLMVDGRLAQLPGAGLPQSNLLPVNMLDMKAVEVVIGPASALYGPNAHTGVVNVATKTPWDDSGAAISLKGGTQSMLHGAARVAGTVKNKLGWKVNGEYLRAEDFKPSATAGTHDYGTPFYEGDFYSSYDVRSAKTDGTLYYRQGDWLGSAGAGYSNSTGFTLTNVGRNHLRGWGVQYQTAQISGPHVYAQVTRTASDAGKTYQIERLVRTVAMAGGPPADPDDLDSMKDAIKLIDESSMIDSELQLRYTLAGVKATLGGGARSYSPSSAGTYLDDKDTSIGVTEAGSYIQLDTTLFQKLRLAGAARVDTHTHYSAQFSPKAAVQYEVAPSHNVRVGYNRAFKTPTVLENFLRINDILLGNRTGFTVRDMAGGGGNVVAEIAPLSPEKVDSLEAGYKAAIGDKVYVDAVVYQSWYRNFISALTGVASPMAGTFATYPDGTPTAAGTPLEGTLQTYLNFGRATVRGADVGADYRPITGLALSASVSMLQLVSFTNDNPLQRDLTLNAPTFKLRGSVQTDDLGLKNSFARLDGRYKNRMAFESGYWNSTMLLGHDVPARVVVDITAGYKFPQYGVTVSGTVANLFDNRDPDVLGAPVVGRFAWLQVAYAFDGLRN